MSFADGDSLYREHDDLREQGRRPPAAASSTTPTASSGSSTSRSGATRRRRAAGSASSSPTSCPRSRRRRTRRSSSRTRSSAAASRAATATGTSARRAATSRRARGNTCFLAVTARDGAEPDRARRPRPPRRPAAAGDRRQRRADADARAPVRQPGDRLERGAVLGRRPARGRAAPERTLRRGRLRVRRRSAGRSTTSRPRPSSTTRRTGRSRTALETMAFQFRGTDNLTAPDELNFECRFIEIELTEEPEPVAAVGADAARADVERLLQPLVGAAARRKACSGSRCARSTARTTSTRRR